MERPSDTNLSPNLAVNHLVDMSHAAVIQARGEDGLSYQEQKLQNVTLGNKSEKDD